MCPVRTVPLLSAVRNNHTEMVDLLARNGANVDVTDALGHGVLYTADRQRNPEMAAILMRHGARDTEEAELIDR